jgi:hypothetical protein
MCFALIMTIKTIHESPWLMDIISVAMRSVSAFLAKTGYFIVSYIVSNYWVMIVTMATLGGLVVTIKSVKDRIDKFLIGYSAERIDIKTSPQQELLDNIRKMMLKTIADAHSGKKLLAESIIPQSMMIPTSWPPYLVAIVLDGNVVGMGSRVDVPSYPHGVLLTAGHVLKDLRGSVNVKLVHEKHSVDLPNVEPSIITSGVLDIVGLDLSPTIWSSLQVKKIAISSTLHYSDAIKVFGFNYDAQLTMSLGVVTPEYGMVMNHNASTIHSWSGSPVVNQYGKLLAIHYGSKITMAENVAHAVTGLWNRFSPESKNGKRNAWIYQEMLDAAERKAELHMASLADKRNTNYDYVFDNYEVQVVPKGQSARFVNTAEKLFDAIEGQPGRQSNGDYIRSLGKYQNYVKHKDNESTKITRVSGAQRKAYFDNYFNFRALEVQNQAIGAEPWDLHPTSDQVLTPERQAEIEKDIVERTVAARSRIKEYEEKITILRKMAEEGIKHKWSDEPLDLDDEDYALIGQLDTVMPESGFPPDCISGAHTIQRAQLPSTFAKIPSPPVTMKHLERVGIPTTTLQLTTLPVILPLQKKVKAKPLEKSELLSSVLMPLSSVATSGSDKETFVTPFSPKLESHQLNSIAEQAPLSKKALRRSKYRLRKRERMRYLQEELKLKELA